MPEFILDHGTRDIEKIEAALGENLVWLADALDLRIRQGDKETIARLAQLNAAWILAVKLAEAAVDAVAAAHLHDALAEMVAQHPKSSRRYGHEGSPVRLQQEDQEAAYDDAVAALALARGEKP